MMGDINKALAATKDAVGALISCAARSESTWTTAVAAGKWSPAQIVEHVARALEESAHVVSGTPSKFPTLPFFVRPLALNLFFKRILKNNAFPKAKTNKAFNPESGPPTAAGARERL